MKRQNFSEILHFCFCLFDSMSHRNSTELPSAVHPLKINMIWRLQKSVNVVYTFPPTGADFVEYLDSYI